MRGSFGEQIHNRTVTSMCLAMMAGAVVGASWDYGFLPSIAALALAFAIGTLAFWHLPGAETIAIQWREQQRLEEEQR